MNIETKFEYGDRLHFINHDRACSSIVQGVKIEGWANETDGPSITYLCNPEMDKQVNIKVPEEKAFKTKQELLNSL